MEDLVPIPNAVAAIRRHARLMAPDQAPLPQASGLALADGIRAPEAVPPFPRAMMDGYALRAADTQRIPMVGKRVGFLPAGLSTERAVAPGEAVKILTGAPLPPGADAVQPIELCREIDAERVEILEPIGAGRNVAEVGSEFPRDELLFERGHVLRGVDIGILATFGLIGPWVHPKPVVRLVNTGTELVECDCQPGPGQIRNSNRHTLATVLAAAGFPCHDLGAVPDSEEAISGAIRDGLDSADVLLLTGGASVGEFDLVEQLARRAGVQVVFTRVAIKPGKPLIFGHLDGRLLFGLSGNPVSAMLQTVRFVLVALRQMAGWADPEPVFCQARLTDAIRHRTGRDSYRPARLCVTGDALVCQPVSDRGSADIFAYRHANAFSITPAQETELPAGSRVSVLPLPHLPLQLPPAST